MIRTLAFCALAATSPWLAATTAAANPYDTKVQASVLTGWKTANGDHITALKLQLEPGWKTYWRSPGDAGIPPEFDWRGSTNLQGVALHWPTPHVFTQNGMRSVGYKREIVLPLTVRPQDRGQPVTLHGTLQIGICEEICVPVTLDISAMLNGSATPKNPAITAALRDQPMTARKAGVQNATCRITPGANGLHIRAAVTMPTTGGPEHAVMETADPQVWVSEPTTRRDGNTLWIEADLEHVSGQPFALERAGLRMTVLGTQRAVDIQGCTAE